MARKKVQDSAPTIDPEPDMAGRYRRILRRRGWLRRAILFGFALAAAPLVLTLVYIAPIFHPLSTLMLKDLALLRGYDRQWVEIEDVAPVMLHSIIMSEDGQFCTHHGIDWRELSGVIDDALDGEASRGASTITMQTVKNLYLWQRPLGTLRKAIEIPYAFYVDLVMSKRRIMEIYVNIAEWGPGIYGVEAAAQHHFGRSAGNLTRRQAALLTAALPNPILRNPGKPSSGLRRIANRIERRAMAAGGYVDCVE
jgi:monofunctional biosynthetic peptidoglycan transglycosylase